MSDFDLDDDILTAKSGHPGNQNQKPQTPGHDNVNRDAGNAEVDLVSFLSNAYKLSVPLFDLRSPNILHWLGGGFSSTVNLFRLGHKQKFYTRQNEKFWELPDGMEVAVKRALTNTDRLAMLNELRILSHPPLRKCPYVVDITGWSIKADSKDAEPLLIIEASPLGDLAHFISGSSTLELKDKMCISINIYRGLDALHKAGVVHGDVKPHNILVFPRQHSDGAEPAGYTTKLCDLGFSIILGEQFQEVSMPRSVPFNAPECRFMEKVAISNVAQTDIFSYGMVLWDIWTNGGVQHRDIWQLEEIKQKGLIIKEMKESLNNQGYHLDEVKRGILCGILEKCLQFDVKDRISSLTSLVPLLNTLIDAIDEKCPHLGAVEEGDSSLTGSTKSITAPVPIPFNEVVLTDAGIFGSRAHAAIFQDLINRAKSKTTRDPCVDSLLSYCYLAGFGVSCDMDLCVKHLAQAAKLGSKQDFSALHIYCETLHVDFPSQLLGMSEEDALFKATMYGSRSAGERLRKIQPEKHDQAVQLLHRKYQGTGHELFGPDGELPEWVSNFDKCLEYTSKDELCRPYNRKKDSILHILALQDDVISIRKLLSLVDISINIENIDKETALFYASRCGHYATTIFLLEQGAIVSGNREGIAPLHWLHRYASQYIEEIYILLIKNGSDINSVSVGPGACGFHPAEWFLPGTPLLWAVTSKRKDVIDFLIKRNASPFLPRHNSALAEAARLHEYETLAHLLDSVGLHSGNPESGERLESLKLFEKILMLPLTQRIARHGPSYITAAQKTILLLIERGFRLSSITFGGPNSILGLVILTSLPNSGVDIVRCILNNGGSAPQFLEAEIGEYGLSPLHCSMSRGSYQIFSLLVEFGADINHRTRSRGYTCLHGCSRVDPEDGVSFAQSLMQLNADLAAGDSTGFTPFMLACLFQRTDLAKYLLSQGSDAYAIDNEGFTVVSVCLSKEALDSLRAVIPDLAEKEYICHPRDGVTALHMVAEMTESANPAAVPMLIQILDAAPRIIDKQATFNGKTALHSAVCRGNEKMVQVLVQRGADLGIRDGNGFTPLEFAVASMSVCAELGEMERYNVIKRIVVTMGLQVVEEAEMQSELERLAISNPSALDLSN